MTLEEAIRIQTIDNDHNPDITDEDRWKAHQLGIEALKFLIMLRKGHDVSPGLLLPGETE